LLTCSFLQCHSTLDDRVEIDHYSRVALCRDMQGYQLGWKRLGILAAALSFVVLGTVYWEYSNQSIVTLPPITNGNEYISFVSSQINSPSNVSLTLRNVGSLTIGLAEYFVKDSNGSEYSNLTWRGPTIQPGAIASVNIVLAGQPSGQPFQIQNGHSYTITLVTARNNPFPYTFTA